MQPKKKFADMEDPLDPLSMSSSTPNFTKKVPKQNAFERKMQEQERALLSGHVDEREPLRNPFGSVGTANDSNKDTSLFGTGNQPAPRNPFDKPGTTTDNSNATLKNPFSKVDRVPILNDGNQSQALKNPFMRGAENQQQQNSSPPRRPFENLKTTDNIKSGEDEQDSLLRVRGILGKVENLEFESNEILPGEKGVASVKCTITPMQYPHLSSEGTLIITTFKVLFKSDDKEYPKKGLFKENYFQIPLGFITKFERTNDKKVLEMTYLDIYSKDGRIFKFRISEKFYDDSNLIFKWLNTLAFPEKKEYFFAFDYFRANKQLEEQERGWQIHDIEKEFQRQGLDFEPLSTERRQTSEHKYRIVDNSRGQICSTYPPRLMIPAKVTDQEFLASSRFRTKERVPSITFYYKKTKTILARSSQSKPGITQARCIEDEVLLRLLGNPDDIFDSRSNEVNLSIYDARPYLNAMANRVNGKGFEDTKWYRNCEIHFMDIDNIHHVRDGHKKLLTMCYAPGPEPANNKWYSQLESSNWLSIMSFIIGASIKIANTLKKGKNVLVHCSDGWDRTSQILSLAQIMLDPYFRTIEGFEVLVMKDWVYFGHQFNLRCGHGNRNEKDDQRSPVFLQFIDCVQQLLHQYPFAFEFNERFLFDLAFHLHSCQFGTFLCNSYQEMKMLKMEERTICVWSFLNSQKDKYYNTYYKYPQDDHPLNPSYHVKFLRLWEEYFLYYSWLSKPNYNLSDSIVFPNDFYEYVLKKERKKVKELKNEVEELKARLSKYENVDDSDEKRRAREEEKEDSAEKINQEDFEEAQAEALENEDATGNVQIENMDFTPPENEVRNEQVEANGEQDGEDKPTTTEIV